MSCASLLDDVTKSARLGSAREADPPRRNGTVQAARGAENEGPIERADRAPITR